MFHARYTTSTVYSLNPTNHTTGILFLLSSDITLIMKGREFQITITTSHSVANSITSARVGQGPGLGLGLQSLSLALALRLHFSFEFTL